MNIAGFLANGTPERLIEAIINCQEQFDDDPPHGMKMGSDRWVYDLQFYRPLMVDAVKRHWAELTSQPFNECPFHDDRIAHMWVAVRKDVFTVGNLRDSLKRVRRDGGLFSSE